MKPFENREDLYAKAIKLEQKSVAHTRLPDIKMHQPRKRWMYSAAMVGTAAALILGFVLVQNRMAYQQYARAQKSLAEINLQHSFVQANMVPSVIQSFNETLQEVSTENQTIRSFNASLNKFRKSNHQTL